MKLFNSKTLTVEPFESIDYKTVRMYTCGPTVYDYAHIGNLRVPIVIDLLHTILKHKVYLVRNFSNITDIDDKIIAKASEEDRSWQSVAGYYEKSYEASVTPFMKNRIEYKAISYEMKSIREMIEDLIEKGFAYVVDDQVLFDTSTNDHHIFVSDPAKLRKGEVASYKRNPADFILWKPAEPGAGWKSTFSDTLGRPGWHIECSAMIKRILEQTGGSYISRSGRQEKLNTIDIHCGGVDLKFPHHENEETQSFCAHGSPLANYWVHIGQLSVDGQKMSKSLGNVILIKDIDYRPRLVKLAMYMTHYRQPLNWTEERVALATKKLVKWEKIPQTYYDWTDIREFWNALEYDMNTPKAIAVIDKWIKGKEYGRAKKAIEILL